MNRRKFAHSTFALAGAAALGTITTVNTASAESTVASPEASPVAGVWNSQQEPVTIEWDTEIFGAATTSGVTGEWCVLRIPDIEHFLSFIIKLEDKFPKQDEALRDYVENDPKLDYPDANEDVTRIKTTEDNGAFGVLYTPVVESAPDTWSYSEFIPSEEQSRRTIQLWISSRRSKLDREMMEAAVSSVTINGEQAVRAIDVAALFDQVEALEVEEGE